MTEWTPPPASALMAASDATWPGIERTRVGGWVVRRGGGGGRRASSVWPAGDPGMALPLAIEAAAQVQRRWGETPMVQIGPDDARVDAALADLGWRTDDETLMLAASAVALATRGLDGKMAVAVNAPLAILDEIWTDGGIGPARRAVMDACACPKQKWLIREEDRPAGAAFVAAAGDVAMLHAVTVAPSFRRKGAGAALVVAAARWAAEQGARTLALAVSSPNAPARALYAKLGFIEALRYHNRTPPAGP